jgi:hypothetical protein
MSRSIVVALATLLMAASVVHPAPQTKRKPAPKPPASRTVTAPADVTCPQVLGTGVGTRLRFCDVMTGKTAAEGIQIALPPHRGVLMLTFDLHNRHTYSEQEVKAGRGYASYTATVAAVAPDNTILGRGIVQSDFRGARDLLDRVSGGAGPRGVKAVAPLGTERIRIEVPQDVTQVSLLGEKLTAVRYQGTETYTFAGPSRPIALISNVTIQYVRAPARRTTTRRR